MIPGLAVACETLDYRCTSVVWLIFSFPDPRPPFLLLIPDDCDVSPAKAAVWTARRCQIKRKGAFNHDAGNIMKLNESRSQTAALSAAAFLQNHPNKSLRETINTYYTECPSSSSGKKWWMDPHFHISNKRAFQLVFVLLLLTQQQVEIFPFPCPFFPPFTAFTCYLNEPSKCQEHKTCNTRTPTWCAVTFMVKKSSPRPH